MSYSVTADPAAVEIMTQPLDAPQEITKEAFLEAFLRADPETQLDIIELLEANTGESLEGAKRIVVTRLQADVTG